VNDEIGAWIARNRRDRGNFPPGESGDRAFSEWQDKYAHALSQIMELPAVKAAGQRMARKNFEVTLDGDQVSFVEKGIHGN